MKKLVIICLTLSITELALALPYFRVDQADEKSGTYLASDIITINIVDNGPVTGWMIDAITDNGKGGTASGEQFNPGWDWVQPGSFNSNGLLIEYIGAAQTTMVPITGILYSFEYHVPDSPYELVYIDTFADDSHFLPYFAYADGSTYEGHLPSLFIDTIVPEPATLALLGLGAVMLRRKRR